MPDQPKDDEKPTLRAVPLDEVRRARGEVKVAMPRSKVASLRAFRRVRADRTIGALGILLLLIGTALIFTWEKPPVVEKKFGVEWPQTEVQAPDITEAMLAAGQSKSHTFSLDVPNATAIVFSLLWKDDVGDQAIEGDLLEFDVKGPAGTNVTNATLRFQSLEGNLTIPLVLNGIPDVSSVDASTEAQARAAVGDRTNRTGIGQWTITVRVVSAAGDVKREELRDQSGSLCDPQLPDNAYCEPDRGQGYTIKVTYYTYGMRLKKLF